MADIPSTGTNAPEAPAPEPQSVEAKEEALIAKYARQAAEARLNSETADPKAYAAARGVDENGEKPRDEKTGKFLPSKDKKDGQKTEAKAKPKAEAAPVQKPKVAEPDGGGAGKGSADPAEAAASDSEPFAGSLGKVKRLVREGKIGEALKRIDLDIEKIPGGVWGAMRKEHRRQEAEVVAAHQEVERQREEVKSEARELVAQLRPFAEAKQALDAGDEDKVFEIIFGKTVDEWQRERLGRMHRGDLRKDPVVTEFSKKLEAEKAERLKLQKLLEERDAREQERAEQAAIERRQMEYREELKDQLANSSDARLARAAELPWFIKMVHAEQLKSYKFDQRTGREDYLTVEEAIERVYDPERLTAAQWKQLTDGQDSSAQRDPGTQNRVATDRRGTDVKRTPRAPTTLSRSEAADPTHKPQMDDEQRIAYYAALHARNLASG